MIVPLQKEKSKMQQIKSINDVIEVKEPSNEPKMVFFMLPRVDQTEISIDVISYVSMNSLSLELREMIREELGIKKKVK